MYYVINKINNDFENYESIAVFVNKEKASAYREYMDNRDEENYYRIDTVEDLSDDFEDKVKLEYKHKYIFNTNKRMSNVVDEYILEGPVDAANGHNYGYVYYFCGVVYIVFFNKSLNKDYKQKAMDTFELFKTYVGKDFKQKFTEEMQPLAEKFTKEYKEIWKE